MTSKTWWGQEFLAALERIMDSGRLQRGRSYSGDFRLKRFSIKLGTVTARMRGNKNPYFGVYSTPYYDVEIKFRKVSPANWNRILKQLGSNADWVTHLVLGEVPPTIVKAFEDANVSLLPATREDINSTCSCPDWANPCKHVAGAYYKVASLVDRDPLVLFQLRGKSRRALHNALKKSEFGAALLGDAQAREPDLGEALQAPRYPEVAAEESDAPPSDLRAFWRGKPLPPETPEERQLPPVSGLLLRRAGDYPGFWPRHNSFLEAMSGVYERVAKGIPPGHDDELPS